MNHIFSVTSESYGGQESSCK